MFAVFSKRRVTVAKKGRKGQPRNESSQNGLLALVLRGRVRQEVLDQAQGSLAQKTLCHIEISPACLFYATVKPYPFAFPHKSVMDAQREPAAEKVRSALDPLGVMKAPAHVDLSSAMNSRTSIHRGLTSCRTVADCTSNDGPFGDQTVAMTKESGIWHSVSDPCRAIVIKKNHLEHLPLNQRI